MSKPIYEKTKDICKTLAGKPVITIKDIVPLLEALAEESDAEDYRTILSTIDHEDEEHEDSIIPDNLLDREKAQIVSEWYDKYTLPELQRIQSFLKTNTI